MKAFYLSILLLIIQGDFDQFIELFPEIKYDEYGNFLTRKLNGKDYSDLQNDYPLISDDQSFFHLCNKDSAKLQYVYGLYDMDKGIVTKYVKKLYKHYAISFFRKEDINFVLYSKFDNQAERFLLVSFDKEGKKVDELVVNQEIRSYTSASLNQFRFSLINPNSIKIFNYEDSENPNKEDNTPLFTKIVIEDYAIDNLGNFNKVAEDSVVLSKPMRAYSKFNIEPEADDPVYKYWTLW